MTAQPDARARAQAFCDQNGLSVPILMAPMAGVSPIGLASAVANAGGMGGCGAMGMQPGQIADWVASFRKASNGAFQLNLWIPDPPPVRDPDHESRLRSFLADWGPEVPPDAAEAALPDFLDQCAAVISARPPAVSSIMGLFPPDVVAQFKAVGVRWCATVTTVGEALAAEAAGADALIVQGMEAGGHRGTFEPGDAAGRPVGLLALLPSVADATRLPLIAAGGIADGRAVAAALTLGAAAVQIGTALLRSPEAAIAPAWADGLSHARPEDTTMTRTLTGRSARALRTSYVDAAEAPDAPVPAPFPVQASLTSAMRAEATARDDLAGGLAAWAGQSAWLARDAPAGEIVTELWQDARNLLP